MKVVIVEPCAEARVEEIDGSLREMQQIVGGKFKEAPFEEFPHLTVISNTDGENSGLEDNFENCDDIIFGTAIICKGGAEDFESLSDEEAEFVCEILNIREG